MSALHADHYAQLARERIAEAKAKWLREHPPPKPAEPDDHAQHAQAARDALRGTSEGDVDE